MDLHCNAIGVYFLFDCLGTFQTKESKRKCMQRRHRVHLCLTRRLADSHWSPRWPCRSQTERGAGGFWGAKILWGRGRWWACRPDRTRAHRPCSGLLFLWLWRWPGRRQTSPRGNPVRSCWIWLELDPVVWIPPVKMREKKKRFDRDNSKNINLRSYRQ